MVAEISFLDFSVNCPGHWQEGYDEAPFIPLRFFYFIFLPPRKQEAAPGSPGARDQSGRQLTTGGFHCRGTSWRRCRLRPGPNSLPAMSAEVKRPSPHDGAPYAKCTSWEEPLTALIFPTHKLLVQDVIWE